MNHEECRELVVRLGFGRLGCASNNQPYLVPIYLAYESSCLFGFSTAGQKIEWMWTNPLVCEEVNEVLGQDSAVWCSQLHRLPHSSPLIWPLAVAVWRPDGVICIFDAWVVVERIFDSRCLTGSDKE